MANMETIPFRRIPGHSRLFLDYLDSAPSALQFFALPPVLGAVEWLARNEIQHLEYPRSAMASILRRQNLAIGGGEKSGRNIEMLAEPGCAAIVTGQQAGIFGGPLYTFYKALTAIQIADEMNVRGIPAIPVFWIECDDHDIAEVTHTTVLNHDYAPARLDYLDLLYGDTRDVALPVSSRILPESILHALAEFESILPLGKGAESIGHLASAYAPGHGFALAFGRLLASLLRDRGLVFFDSSDPEAKHLAVPVFQAAAEEAHSLLRELQDRRQALEKAHYHSQVTLASDSSLLFYREDAERRALSFREEHFRVKNTSRVLNRDELLINIISSPERFSPNVLLRPLVQDHLFPTAAYVAGPGEIAYFAQAGTLYRYLDHPMPVVWPRASFTLLEPEIAAAMEQADIDLEDVLQGLPHVAAKLVEAARQSSSAIRLEQLRLEIETKLADVRPALAAAELSLGPALDTAQRKILQNIEGLHTRLLEHEAQKDHSLSISAAGIVNSCYPNRKLQERELGIFPFLARHGIAFLETIASKINLTDFSHMIIRL